ncbi:cell wall-associated NlpC family hydrolase [Catenulispora sp. GAS73]|uniref:C40 family peptidase n=1 Tax=Catenulispora sp. GAS73 TaxID=3156269 RepID=UPI00351179D1
MGKVVAAVAAGLLALITLIGAAGAGVASALGLGSDSGPPSDTARIQIPPTFYLTAIHAAAECPGLSWTVLAAIAKESTDFGQNTGPDGTTGPMGLTNKEFTDHAAPVPPGGADPASAADLVDAMFATTRLLCDSGARNGTDLKAALKALRDDDTFVTAVQADAATYGGADTGTAGGTAGGTATAGPLPAAPGPAQAAAIAFAQSQLGLPYVWGAENPGVSFDCSGLVQAAYNAAGIHLPRVATDQYNATIPIPPGTPLLPGDLVYYGTAPNNLEHIGIYIGNGLMIDAPHTGAVVRVEPFRYQGDNYAGATRVVKNP